MNRTLLLMVVWITLVLLRGGSAAAEEIVDETFGFRFDVPPAFTSIEVEAGSDTLYRFVDREPSAEAPANVIQIQRLRGLVNPTQRLREDEIPAPDQEGVVFSLSEPRVWQGWTLDVMATEIATPDHKMTTLTIQFPLQNEGVQLVVGGPDKQIVEEAFDMVVAGFVNTQPLYTGKQESSGPVGKDEPPAEITFPYKGVAIFGVLILILVTVVGKWIRSGLRGRTTAKD